MGPGGGIHQLLTRQGQQGRQGGEAEIARQGAHPVHGEVEGTSHLKGSGAIEAGVNLTGEGHPLHTRKKDGALKAAATAAITAEDQLA